MKRYLSLLLLPLAACSFLDEHPRDQKPREEIVIDGHTLYLNTLGNLYSLFGGSADSQGLMGTYRGVYDLETFTTDEAILPTRGGDWYDGGLWQRLYLHAWETGEAPLKDTWNYLYKVVVLANQAIADLSGYPALAQEARAVRALYYYYLLDLFGNVPLVESPTVAMNEVAQAARADVFAFVVSELEAVADDLALQRSNMPGTWYGRMTRPVAWFLLAKLYLNASVYAGQDLSAKAIPYCDALTDFGYALEDDYAANFAVYNENSVENILTIPMDKILYSNQFQYLFRSRHYDHAAACGFTGENGASATREVLEANGFGTADEDPRFAVNYWGSQPVDLSGDPILLASGGPLVYRPWSVALDVTGTPDEKLAGARMRKYELDPSGMKDGKLVDNDIVLFRYADVLLMKAEALLCSGGDVSEALSLVNQVRRRAGARERTSLTLADLLDERLVEFAWEGLRRQDLVRFGAFTRPYSSRPQLPRESSGYTTLFPLPADILTLNPLLSQNPGY